MMIGWQDVGLAIPLSFRLLAREDNKNCGLNHICTKLNGKFVIDIFMIIIWRFVRKIISLHIVIK